MMTCVISTMMPAADAGAIGGIAGSVGTIASVIAAAKPMRTRVGMRIWPRTGAAASTAATRVSGQKNAVSH